MPTGLHVKVMAEKTERLCPHCDLTFFAVQASQRFCCQECRWAWRKRRLEDLRQMLEGVAMALAESGIDLQRLATEARERRAGTGVKRKVRVSTRPVVGKGRVGGGTVPPPAPASVTA